jgi:hypothetical protein
MKKAFLFSLFLVFIIAKSFCQQMTDLAENGPYLSEGMEYGYTVTNKQVKEVKGDEYDRFEISLYVSNKGTCLRLIPFQYTTQENTVSNREKLLAEFICKNATGKRLTAKGGKVEARPWYTNVKFLDEKITEKDKNRTVRAQVGFAIRPGETLRNSIIIIVPKGETPVFSCRIYDIPELR